MLWTISLDDFLFRKRGHWKTNIKGMIVSVFYQYLTFMHRILLRHLFAIKISWSRYRWMSLNRLRNLSFRFRLINIAKLALLITLPRSINFSQTLVLLYLLQFVLWRLWKTAQIGTSSTGIRPRPHHKLMIILGTILPWRHNRRRSHAFDLIYDILVFIR